MGDGASADIMLLTNENIINAYQNEPTLWDTCLNADEGQKELTWQRFIAQCLESTKVSYNNVLF